MTNKETTAKTEDTSGIKLSQISFLLFMGGLTILFACLSNWQFQRLEWKLGILHDIQSRSELAPASVPPANEWAATDPNTLSYAPVKITGRFAHQDTVLSFTSLPSTKGLYSGPGYWVVTPLELTEGGTIYVNRGFIPQELETQFRNGGIGADEEVDVTGLARLSERTNLFTPVYDRTLRLDYVRNIERMTEITGRQGEAIAPFMVDLDAVSSTLPQGGETRMTVTNRHFDYALTWMALGIITPIMSLFWWMREKRKPKPETQT